LQLDWRGYATHQLPSNLVFQYIFAEGAPKIIIKKDARDKNQGVFCNILRGINAPLCRIF
jgi:hypothetical protein